MPVSRPSPVVSSRPRRGTRHWCLPKLSHLPSLPPSQLCSHTRAPFISQAEEQTLIRSWPGWRVLTRAAFIGALAQAQTKQDTGSEAAGRMGPVWAEAAGVKSAFSSPCMASPSLRLCQPCVRAKGTSLLPLAPCCAVLLGPGSIWSRPKETTCGNPTTIIRPVQTQQHSLLGRESNCSSLVKTEKDKKTPNPCTQTGAPQCCLWDLDWESHSLWEVPAAAHCCWDKLSASSLL